MKQSTICVQSGWQPKKGEPRVLPIYQSTTFRYETSDQMARLFDLKESGFFYTRLQNPTNECVAKKIAELEGGVACILTSSGQSALFYAVFNICEAGGHIVCCSAIYGGTYNLFAVTLKKLGIDVTFVDQNASSEEIQKAFRPNTKCLFGETISNPSLQVLDIDKMARLAHRNGVPLIVDNTFATPINCRPIEHGADIVVHSTSKYMDGHAQQVGGAIVDSGKFDWKRVSTKFPGLTQPDDSYHGLVYTDAFGEGAYITKCTVQLMRDLGAIPPLQRVPAQPGAGDAAPARAPPLRERPEGGGIPGEAGRRGLDQLLRSALQQVPQPCHAPVRWRPLLRRGHLRHQGRTRALHQVHRQPQADGHRHPCGGCPHQCAPSRQPHPPPTDG